MDLVAAVLYLSFATSQAISDDQCRDLINEQMGRDAIQLAQQYQVTFVCVPATAVQRINKISKDNLKQLKRDQNLRPSTVYQRCGDRWCTNNITPPDYDIQLK
tara:strand:- start:15152 stop:15460 length:309 start_codon:yes stop_codon:yes gene_type:complete